MDEVNLKQKLELFDDHWSPRVVGELDGQHVKLVKYRGEFAWKPSEAILRSTTSRRGAGRW